MYPNADIPVVQLSIDASKDPDYHVSLGATLALLRQHGVLIPDSGNVVHNLRMLDRHGPDQGYDWAIEFDQAASQLMAERPGDVTELLVFI